MSSMPMEKFSRHSPLATDLYQITMVHTYWTLGKHNEIVTFEMFFRKNPFGGEYTIFSGLSDVLEFLKDFRFTELDIQMLKSVVDYEDEFYDFLRSLNCRELKVKAVREGETVFPNEPLIQVTGPLAMAQLIETHLLNFTGYASLVATKARRLKNLIPSCKLVELGLRRAHGPDGGYIGTKHCYIGGCDATSNVQTGILEGIPVVGTHAHSYVQAFNSLERLDDFAMMRKDEYNGVSSFKQFVLSEKERLGITGTNESELASFIALAQVSPNNFTALLDTYNCLKSGLPNFICVASALISLGYQPIGVRIDSGDLGYLSIEIHKTFQKYAKFDSKFENCTIIASNDIDETVLESLIRNGHKINVFGVGTKLITGGSCSSLGMVYKMVENEGIPKMKFSEDSVKMTIPGKKSWIVRLFGRDDIAILDLMGTADQSIPKPNEIITCYHPTQNKSIRVEPSRIGLLLIPVFENGEQQFIFDNEDSRKRCNQSQACIRDDMKRLTNPTPYKMSITTELDRLTKREIEKVQQAIVVK